MQTRLECGGRNFEEARFRRRDRGLESKDDIILAVHDLLSLGDIVEFLGGEALAGQVRAVAHLAADCSQEIVSQLDRDRLADPGFFLRKNQFAKKWNGLT
ncbi:MAG: hypothetical protein ACK55Z_02070, partial [bacterium]